MSKVKAFLPDIPKPKTGINYDKESLAASTLTSEQAQTLVKIALKKVGRKNVSIIEFSPNLGTVTWAFLQDDRVDAVYSVSADEKVNNFYKTNLSIWGLEEVVQLVTQPKDLDIKNLRNNSIVILKLDKGNLVTLPVFLRTWHYAPLIVLRGDVNTVLPEAPFLIEKTQIKGSEEVDFFLTYYNKEEEKWKEDIKQFLREFLPKFIENKPFPIDRYLSEEYMHIWESCWTHDSFDPSFNYEELELLGDRSLELNLTKYFMYFRFKHLNKHEITSLKSRYVDKNFLKSLSPKYGFTKFVRAEVGLNQHVREDIFESFLGALELVSDTILFGLSAINSFNFVSFVYNDVDIDLTATRGKKTMIVPQLFEQLGFTKKAGLALIETSEPTENDFVKFTISVTDQARKAIKGYGINLPIVLGAYTAPVQKEARDKAYEEAGTVLENIGFSKEWTQKIKRVKDLNQPGVVEYLPAAKAKLKKQGYIDLYFQSSRTATEKNKTTSTLIGLASDGTEVTLSNGHGIDSLSAQIDAIKNYVKG